MHLIFCNLDQTSINLILERTFTPCIFWNGECSTVEEKEIPRSILSLAGPSHARIPTWCLCTAFSVEKERPSADHEQAAELLLHALRRPIVGSRINSVCNLHGWPSICSRSHLIILPSPSSSSLFLLDLQPARARAVQSGASVGNAGMDAKSSWIRSLVSPGGAIYSRMCGDWNSLVLAMVPRLRVRLVHMHGTVVTGQEKVSLSWQTKSGTYSSHPGSFHTRWHHGWWASQPEFYLNSNWCLVFSRHHLFLKRVKFVARFGLAIIHVEIYPFMYHELCFEFRFEMM